MKKYILFLMPLLLLCGCYPYTEIENTDILTSLYADAANGAFHLGGGVANVRNFSDAMAEDPVSLLYTTGENLENAVENLHRSADHELFYGALRAVLIGDSLGKKDIYPLVRYLDAQPRLRRATAVFTTDGDIEEIVTYKAINDFSGGFAADSIVSTLYQRGEMRAASIGDILYARSLGDAGYCIPHITLREDTMQIDGYTLFRGSQAVGFTESKAIPFFTVKNAAQQHIVDGQPLTTKLNKKRILPKIQDNKLHIDVAFTFALAQGQGADTLKPARHKDARQRLKSKLKTEVEDALALVRETQCDFLEIYKSQMAQSRADFDMKTWNKLLKTMTYSVSITLK